MEEGLTWVLKSNREQRTSHTERQKRRSQAAPHGLARLIKQVVYSKYSGPAAKQAQAEQPAKAQPVSSGFSHVCHQRQQRTENSLKIMLQTAELYVISLITRPKATEPGSCWRSGSSISEQLEGQGQQWKSTYEHGSVEQLEIQYFYNHFQHSRFQPF